MIPWRKAQTYLKRRAQNMLNVKYLVINLSELLYAVIGTTELFHFIILVGKTSEDYF
jgi:hypothetical protein